MCCGVDGVNAITKKPWLLTGSRGYGGASFDINFLSGSLGSGAVFSRASPGWSYNGSGVLVQSGANVPRFDYDPVTLQPKGLLLEDTSTNLVLNSGDASNASWTPSGGGGSPPPVVTANQTAAPDGTMTAALVNYPAVVTASFSYLNPAILVVSAAPYAFSVWLRGNAGGERLYLSCTPDGVTYHTLLVVLTTAWQRFSFITPNLAVTSGWYFIIGTDLRDGAAQAATPAQTIYAWGAQIEAIGYMTSYIPTTTAAVTRAADALSYPIASVTGFDQTKGSLQLEYILVGSPPSYNAPVQFVGANTATDFIDVDNMTTPGQTPARETLAGSVVVVNGTTISLTDGRQVPVPIGVVHKGAASWALNAAQMLAAHDGVADGPGGAISALPVITALTIAGPMHYQAPISQWARRVRYWPRQLSQAELITETALDLTPALDLDFMTPGALDKRIAFTRASTATYTDQNGTIRTAAVNAPRWDYAGGALNGLLIEEARTNVFYPSANWATQALTPTSDGWINNVGIAPDGTNAAMALVPCVTNTVHQFFEVFSLAFNTTYTYTAYLKTAGYKFASVSLGNSGFPVDQTSTFDLSNGTIQNQSPNGTATIQAVGGGWYRCSVTNTTAATATGPCVADIIVYDNNGNFVFAGDGVSGVWAWGSQLEAGAFPTSYIPTTSAVVTRAQDVASMPTGAWFNAAASSLMAEYMVPLSVLNTTPSNKTAWSISDGTTGNRLALFAVTSGAATTMSGTGIAGVITNVSAVGNVVGGVTTKFAASWDGTTNANTLNGTMGGSAAVGMPSGLTTVVFGTNGLTTNNNILNAWLCRTRYWPRQLSQAELISVTT